MAKNHRFIPLFAALLLSSVSFAEQPLNLSCAKEAVKNYYFKGDFIKDVNAVIQDAEEYLKKRIEENKLSTHPKKLAMVLDIDDTSLSNFTHNEADDFSNNPDIIEQNYREANSPAIPQVLRLYNQAYLNGVDIFFISFRPEEFRSYTESNLEHDGYRNWKALYLASPEDIKNGARAYKKNIRKMLVEDQGYDIILNLGDQDSDLDGGSYADHTDKIPNPMYQTSPCNSQKEQCQQS